MARRTGEGGEQGDATMPCIPFVNMTPSKWHIGTRDGEHLMALFDVYMATQTAWVLRAQQCKLSVAGGRNQDPSGGKTKVWNKAGVRRAICDDLEKVAHQQNLSAQVWRGAGIPEQGIKI